MSVPDGSDELLGLVIVVTTPGAALAVVLASPLTLWWNKTHALSEHIRYVDAGLALWLAVTLTLWALSLFWRFIKALP